MWNYAKKKTIWILIGTIILIEIIITTYLLWPKDNKSLNTKSTPQYSNSFPTPIFPPPEPREESYKIGYLLSEMKNGAWKYEALTLNNKEITWNDFINLLKQKNDTFFKFFQGMLKGLDSKLGTYFWKCPPVSKTTLNKPFEFVAIKSQALNNITQDTKPFSQYLMLDAFVNEKPFASFSNNSKNAILIIPALEFGRKTAPCSNDYKNLSQFTQNAPLKQQQEFWAEVANKLAEELEKDNSPRWLNTHGLRVHYLHVRIDKKPKYYSEYEEYKKWE